MASMTEKVNSVSIFISKLTGDPAERFAIADVLVEMYRHEMNKQFVPIPPQEEIK